MELDEEVTWEGTVENLPSTASETGPMHVAVDGDDGDDEVVKVIDVFLSQEAAKHVYLVQYPLRPTWRPYDRRNIAEVRHKPSKRMLNLEYALTDEEMALHYDTAVEDRPKSFTLASTPVPPQTNYALALLRSGPEREQLHLTPIAGIYQMRPSFAHIDAQDEAEKKSTEEKDGKIKTEEEAERAVEVKVKTPRPRERQNPQAQRKEEPPEPWKKLNYLDQDVSYDGHRAIWTKLIAKQTQDVAFDMPRERYLDDIASNKGIEQNAPTTTQPSVLTLTDIKKLASLEQQVFAVLARAHTAPFEKLIELLDAKEKEDQVAQVVKDIAILVNGRLVIRSEQVTKGRTTRVRNYMLLLFHQQGVINRPYFIKKANVSSDKARELLSQVAECVRNEWLLKHPRDDYFIDKYPEIAAQHNAYWIENAAHISGAAEDAMEAEFYFESDQPQPQAHPIVTTHDDENQFFQGEVANQLKNFIKHLFRMYGVVNLAFLKSQLHDQQEKDPILNRGVPDALIRHVLNEIACHVQSAYCAKSLGDPAIDKFRAVIVDLYRGRISLRKKDIEDECQLRLKEKPPQTTYKKIMNELSYSTGGQWVIKKGSGNDP